jgi:hypothetical protein
MGPFFILNYLKKSSILFISNIKIKKDLEKIQILVIIGGGAWT